MQAQEKMTAANLLVGGDPEFFLYDRKISEYVSAHNMLPGTKEAPHKMKCGHVQVDGTAVEFNIDPASSEEEFIENVHGAINCIREMVDPRYDFIFTPYVQYTAPTFAKIPKKALELGCNPDFNGYTFQRNPVPNTGGKYQMIRTGSGHVTVGFTPELLSEDEYTGMDHLLTCGRIARNLDVTLGVPSVDWDRDRVRRGLYGQAGAFRPKPFGIEYRVLSNKWLTSTDYMRLVYRGAVEGVLDYFNNDTNCMFMQQRQDDVIQTINEARRRER